MGKEELSLDKKLSRTKDQLDRAWESYVDQAANYIGMLHSAMPPEFYKELRDLFSHFKIHYFLQPANEAKGARNLYIEHNTVPKGLRARVYTLPGVIVSIKSDKLDELMETKIANEIIGLKIAKGNEGSQNIVLDQDFDSLEKLTLKQMSEVNITTILPELKSIEIDNWYANLKKLAIPIAPALEEIRYMGSTRYGRPYLLVPKHTNLTFIPKRATIERYEP